MNHQSQGSSGVVDANGKEPALSIGGPSDGLHQIFQNEFRRIMKEELNALLPAITKRLWKGIDRRFQDEFAYVEAKIDALARFQEVELNNAKKTVRSQLYETRRLQRYVEAHLNNNEPPAFPQFRRLPAEIRSMIWECTTPRRVLEIRHVEAEEDWPNSLGLSSNSMELAFWPNYPPPVASSVCRESRAVVLRGGRVRGGASTIWLQKKRQHTYTKEWSWFDPNRDVLFLNFAWEDEDDQAMDCECRTLSEMFEMARHILIRSDALDRFLWNMMMESRARVDRIAICNSVHELWPRRHPRLEEKIFADEGQQHRLVPATRDGWSALRDTVAGVIPDATPREGLPSFAESDWQPVDTIAFGTNKAAKAIPPQEIPQRIIGIWEGYAEPPFMINTARSVESGIQRVNGLPPIEIVRVIRRTPNMVDVDYEESGDDDNEETGGDDDEETGGDHIMSEIHGFENFPS
ncbi:hypothetical protein F4778DRAFT_752846, partial [Xylariomycetidae sp. FL2044]